MTGNQLQIKRVFTLATRPEDGLFLSILRADDNTWGLPGGKVEVGEDPLKAAIRENIEEVGLRVEKLMSAYTFSPIENIGCIVYMCLAPHGYIPKLNAESVDYKWSTLDDWPQPSHPQMARVIEENKTGFIQSARALLLV